MAAPKPPAPGSNVISIVDQIERRQLAGLREKIDAMHLRKAEGLLAPFELRKQLEGVDFDAALREIDESDEIDDPTRRRLRGELRCSRGYLACLAGDLEAGVAEWTAIMEDIPEIALPHVLRAHWKMGHDLPGALADLDRAAALEPANPAVYWRRGQCYTLLGDDDRALANYRRTLAITPDQIDALEAIAKILTARGQHAEAVATYDRAIALAPRYVDLYQARAEARQEIDDLDGAVRDYDRILELVPGRTDARYYRAHCHRAADRTDLALRELAAIVALEPDNGLYRASYGNALGESGAMEEALVQLDRAVELLPDDAAAYSARSAVLTALGRPERALADLDRAIALDPGEGTYALRRTMLTLPTLDPVAARAAFEALSAALPEQAWLAEHGARLASKDGDHARAIALLDAAIAENPGDPALHLERAKAYAQVGPPEKAILDARRAAELAPGNAEAHALCGYYQQFVECDEARIEADFTRALELAPDNVSFREERVKFYLHVGRTGSAKRDYDRLIELLPARGDLYEDRAWSRYQGEDWTPDGEPPPRDTEAEADARHRASLADYLRAQELGVSTDTLFTGLAWQYRELGDKEAALATLDRGIAAFPEEPTLFFWRSEFRTLYGDAEGAAADRARAKELGYAFPEG
jgi:tetratricopeptide (TPR) repeat protein